MLDLKNAICPICGKSQSRYAIADLKTNGGKVISHINFDHDLHIWRFGHGKIGCLLCRRNIPVETWDDAARHYASAHSDYTLEQLLMLAAVSKT